MEYYIGNTYTISSCKGQRSQVACHAQSIGSRFTRRELVYSGLAVSTLGQQISFPSTSQSGPIFMEYGNSEENVITDTKIGYQLVIPKFKFKSGESQFIVVQEPTSYEEAEPGKGYGRLRDVANFLEPKRAIQINVYAGRALTEIRTEPPNQWDPAYCGRYFINEREPKLQGNAVEAGRPKILNAETKMQNGYPYSLIEFNITGRRGSNTIFDEEIRHGYQSVTFREFEPGKWRVYGVIYSVRGQLWDKVESQIQDAAERFRLLTDDELEAAQELEKQKKASSGIFSFFGA